MAWPPYLTTNVSLANLRMYGSASDKVAAVLSHASGVSSGLVFIVSDSFLDNGERDELFLEFIDTLFA